VILFLVTFLTLYGGLHLFAFLRLRRFFQPGRFITLLMIAWAVIMTVIPLLVRVAEQSGSETTALCIAWPGYLWMGFIFIFTSTLLLTDLIRLTMRCSEAIFPFRAPQLLTSRVIDKLVLFVSLVASSYACYEASSIRSNHVAVTSAKLPASISRIRIVQISDVHIGLLLQQRKLQLILDKIKEAKPDILISTGDLVDGKLNRTDSISGLDSRAAQLAAIPAPLGKFAVLGNHEVYAGLPQALAFTRASGFTILRNQYSTLANGITISGVDDQAINPDRLPSPGVETTLFKQIDTHSFNLFLKHRPDIVPESDGAFDLQLSGHVHGGQIFPFIFLTKIKFPIPGGMSSTPKGSHLYLSRGTGTWGPPMRLFAPPEITIIDVMPSPSQTTRR
jgi:predicted MPP superfamily phosphohydrolase